MHGHRVARRLARDQRERHTVGRPIARAHLGEAERLGPSCSSTPTAGSRHRTSRVTTSRTRRPPDRGHRRSRRADHGWRPRTTPRPQGRDPHGGGNLCYGIARIDRGWEANPKKQVIPRKPSTYLRNLYYDSITWGEPQLRFLVDQVGADRVVIGSDWPTKMGPDSPGGWVTPSAPSPATKRSSSATATWSGCSGSEAGQPAAP